MSLSYLLVKPVTINGKEETIVRPVKEYDIPRYIKHGWYPLDVYFEPNLDIII